MNKKVNNIVRIPSSLDTNFFKYWFLFLAPFHKLTEREIDVIAPILKHRYRLSKVINDPAILDQVTLSTETLKKVREECNITVPHFQVMLSKLRKAGLIENGRINKRFIPNIVENDNTFQLLLLFDFTNDKIG